MASGDESDRHTSPALYRTPARASEELARFIEALQETFGFVYFATGMAARIDDMQRIAADALANLGEADSDERSRSEGRTMNEFRRFRFVVLEMLLSRGVDNFSLTWPSS